MSTIGKSHYKLLKRISRRTTISAESLSEEELDISLIVSIAAVLVQVLTR